MKKVTVIFGILSALFIVLGVCFKTFHQPGADILLISSIGGFLMVYLVLLCIQKIIATRGLEMAMNIVKYASYLYLAMGALFLINNYPGAIMIFDLGCCVFVAVFLPLKYVVQKKKNPDSSPLNKVLPSIIVIALVFLLINRSLYNRLFESIAYTDIQVNTMSKSVDTSTTHLLMEFELNKTQFAMQFAPKYEKALTIKHLSDSLVDFLNTCKAEVIHLTNPDEDLTNFGLEDLSGRANTIKPSLYFVKNSLPDKSGQAYEIRKRIEALNDSIKTICKADETHQISVPVLFGSYKSHKTGREYTWEEAMFEQSMLITDLAYLDVLILSVKQTEKEVVNSLLLDARSETMWTFWKKYKELVPDRHTK